MILSTCANRPKDLFGGAIAYTVYKVIQLRHSPRGKSIFPNLEDILPRHIL